MDGDWWCPYFDFAVACVRMCVCGGTVDDVLECPHFWFLPQIWSLCSAVSIRGGGSWEYGVCGGTPDRDCVSAPVFGFCSR